ncbi:MAG: LysR family transcriptional regulator [Armatimonadota bacterium]|nr:LysR family transcriptional regulator [Armatimonadota bacterium]
MNYNHLMIFQAVAEEGSVSRGAERLCISQPAVSKQLAVLEASLKTKLLDRLPKGVRLTEAGELLLGYVQRMSRLEREAEQAMAELQGLARGTLTVGASLTVGAYLMPEILAEYGRRYPKIALTLEIANTEVIQRMLLDGKLDIGLTEGFADAPDLDAAVFAEDELVAIAPPGHPLLQQASITVERLLQEPLILREPGSGTRAVLERALAERGLTVTPLMSLGSTEAIKRAVAAGAGLAVISRLALGLELEMGRLTLLLLSDLTLRRSLHRLTRRGAYQSRALRAFQKLLAEIPR